ncbi:sigma factor-like helix-turn-helix DNA-binding protein [Nonomuraea sp. C10]|uniref:sigma factor-like helix-turn-helix DNA-binding protein n=1 Tax=Nonomuraea sp. C10 TaxID=2600577 RepID=UPI0021C432F9|nr:sigma factor-like helix-turn-helix DNA-binding protein [Nonomuraea sp. C10]
MVTVDDGAEPAEYVALADSVGLALLAVLDSLGPSERLAFVLHDLFAVPFAEIGQILGKSADAPKMIASRARKKVQAIERPTIVGREQRQVIHAFRAAAVDGNFEALLRVLDPDVKLTVDTPNGVVVTLGATAVASGAQMFSGAVARHRAVIVNDLPGFISWREDGTPLSNISFAVTHNRITAIAIVADPTRLASMQLPDPS